MKTIQFILFLAFISGASILMINSGRVSPQVEQQHNSYWTIIAKAQSDPVSTYESPEPDHPSLPPDILTTRSTDYYRSAGRGVHTNRNHSAGGRALSTTNKTAVQSSPLNPLHSRIIQSTLQPMDLLISPDEASNYAATLDAKTQ
jgi:hypothetical protein